MAIKYVWDGEKVKQVVEQRERKYTPRDILDAIDQIKGKISQNSEQKLQVESQLKMIESNLKNLKKDEKDLVEFEEKCIESQKEKLKLYISQLTAELKQKAQKQADETISKDKNIHSETQIKQMPYLNYQRLLATHVKISTNISRRIITKYIFDKPIFKNPFV